MRHSILAAAIGLAAMVAPHSAGAGIVIDTFDTPQQAVAGSFEDFTIAAPEAIGGFRTLFVSNVSGDGTAVFEVANGALFLGGDSTRRNAAVIWNGGGLPPVGLGGVDLTGDGLYDRFLIRAGTFDVDGDTTFTLIVTSDAQHRSLLTMTVIAGGGSTLFALPFADFQTNDAGPADFTDVRDIVMTFGTNLGVFAVDYIVVTGAVPEPPVLLLLLSLLAALTLQRRLSIG
jgi:hypothetical protein